MGFCRIKGQSVVKRAAHLVAHAGPFYRQRALRKSGKHTGLVRREREADGDIEETSVTVALESHR
jgi:hypothetical protein